MSASGKGAGKVAKGKGGGGVAGGPPAEEDMEAFVERQLEMLKLECSAEESAKLLEQENLSLKQLENKGVALANLTPTDRRSGLGGRTLITLERIRGGVATLLPAHKLTNGDIVAMRDASKAAGPATKARESDHRGLVYKTTDAKVVVAVEGEAAEEMEGSFHLFKAANDVTYKRYRHVLGDLRDAKECPGSRLVSLLLGGGGGLPHFRPIPEQRAWKPINGRLNKSQMEAVDLALAASDLAVIHGPPGTGKTTTVVELICQCVARGEKVLATAPSNVAVDNIAERLAECGVPIVRIGHPARVLESVVRRTLDVMVQGSDERALASDARGDMQRLLARIGKERDKGGKARMRRELGELRREARKFEEQGVAQVMGAAKVVLCTNAGAADPNVVRHAPEGGYDACVVDEAAMALEVSCWIPILRSRRLVLAGDHCQLAPTVMSEEAGRMGLGRTLFDRVVDRFGGSCVRMLDVQYRMAGMISDWCSGAMYGGVLRAGEGVAARALADLPGVEGGGGDDEAGPVMLVVDTAGCACEEDRDEAGSARNEGEAAVVAEHVRRLAEAGVRGEDIGVLAPYNAQVALLRETLRETYPAVEVGTVDGFQGREKEAVVLSLVRSNDRGEVGFLKDDRRINVAVSRARRQVCIVCDTICVSSHPFLKGLIAFCDEMGADYRSAAEYLPDGGGGFAYAR